ncbi:MAG: hypothetical protein WAV22_08525, partial [Porticoccaceae bacterium]
TDLFTLLAAQRTAQDSVRAEIAARIAAHAAIDRALIDAHELWAYHHQEDDEAVDGHLYSH